MLSIGSREVVRIELRGEVSCQELDDSPILFLLKCGVEHLSVLRQVVGLVFGAISVWFRLRTLAISLAMNSLVGAAVRLR